MGGVGWTDSISGTVLGLTMQKSIEQGHGGPRLCPRQRGDCGGLKGPRKILEGTWGEGEGGRIFINSFRNLCYFSKEQGHTSVLI